MNFEIAKVAPSFKNVGLYWPKASDFVYFDIKKCTTQMANLITENRKLRPQFFNYNSIPLKVNYIMIT